MHANTMTTLTNNSSRRNRLRESDRDRGYPGNRDCEPRTGSIACDADGAILEEPKAASSRAAFVAGVKATAPVLLALVPFALAFGTMAAGSGLSTLEALAMSVFVFAGAAQLAMIPLISAGASVAVIVLTVLVINLRMTLYSASLAPHFRLLPAG